MSFYYLATPYNGHTGGVSAAYMDAVEQAGVLLRAGIYVYAPIAHTHPIAVKHGLPGGFDFWEGYDRVMLEASAGLIVCKLPGWDVSKGVTAEREIAQELGRPVFWMEPGVVPGGLA